MAQDRFTKLAEEYARYRPGYPDQLAEYLASLTKGHRLAWDCATGNGQMAVNLSPRFTRVLATDISPGQVAHARERGNILYALARAERTPLAADSVDLITVAQAIHWFDLDVFYREVARVLQTGGILSAWGYGQPEISPEVDEISAHYFNDILGPYLPARIKMVTQQYRSLPFPFQEITPPQFTMQTRWTLDHLLGMLASLSPVLSYQKDHGSHPVEQVYEALREAWGPPAESRRVRWGMFFKIGRKGE